VSLTVVLSVLAQKHVDMAMAWTWMGRALLSDSPGLLALS